MSWWMFFGFELRQYIIADSVGCWYWHGKKGSGSNVSRAFSNAITKHIGTIAYAGQHITHTMPTPLI